MQKYFRTRENRNFSTVQSTEKRIFNFSLIEVIMMVGMAGIQVLVVRFFFQGARKGKCWDEACDTVIGLADMIQAMYETIPKLMTVNDIEQKLCCAHSDSTFTSHLFVTGLFRAFAPGLSLKGTSERPVPHLVIQCPNRHESTSQ